MELRLNSLSWQQLTKNYIWYGEQLAECQRLVKVFKFRLPLQLEIQNLEYIPLGRALVASKLLQDVNRINYHLAILEREIERRTALVGFM